jgi:hypothetical protein
VGKQSKRIFKEEDLSLRRSNAREEVTTTATLESRRPDKHQ